MLSYLHSFHAGNHADLLKHATLLYTIGYFNQKGKPYTIFDSHAGSGLYNLRSKESLKTKEALNGIETFIFRSNCLSEIPKSAKLFVDFMEHFVKNDFYPGSPAIELLLKKEDCPLFLTELHKGEFKKLNQNISQLQEINSVLKSKVFIKNISAWDFLKSNIPPQIKSGFLLCDPSYEELSDYENVKNNISEISKKWNGATILLWYPLLSYRIEIIQNMKDEILKNVRKENPHTEILDAQFLIDNENSHTETDLASAIGSEKPRLYGSGMFVINPCWGLNDFLEEFLNYAHHIIKADATYSVKML